MSDEVSIRECTSDDLAAVADLAADTWMGAFGDTTVTASAAETEVQQTRSVEYFEATVADNPVIVAERDGELVGYVQFGGVQIQGVVPAEADRELQRLYVRPGDQGQGVARALALSALGHPTMSKAKRIYLQVWEENTRAVGIYIHLGFRVVGRTAFSIGSAEEAEDLVMVLER